MPRKEKDITLRRGALRGRKRLAFYALIKRLFNVDPLDYLPDKLYYTCFNDICLIYGKYLDTIKPITLYEDSWVGLYIRDTLVPSIPLTTRIYERVGFRSALVVGEQGVKAFLYGNDILRESVIEIIPPNTGLYAVIDSMDNSVIGFARWNKRKDVYENIYDLGLFLRELG